LFVDLARAPGHGARAHPPRVCPRWTIPMRPRRS
jgi:hypothetical protein